MVLFLASGQYMSLGPDFYEVSAQKMVYIDNIQKLKGGVAGQRSG